VNRRQILQRLVTAAAGLRLAPSMLWAQASAPQTHAAEPALASYKFGVSYYPEQWPAAQVPDDFAKMRDLGINLVRMGEFAWSSIQPAPTLFHFEWLDQAVSLASKNGIAVILGTPTASVPPWLYRLHPDVLSGNEKGPYTYGGRKGFALDSPAMRDAASEIITRLAARYGNNSAVVGWQLSNEPGYPMVNFDPNSLRAFRLWLKQRYGTIQKLNDSWSGSFWSNQYDSWDEIYFPTNSAEGGQNPGVHLDYRRFFSDSFLRWLRFEAGLVRRHARNQFVYTNWPEVAWSVDIFKTGAFLDATAWDNYGAMPGTASPYDVLRTAFNHDLCRATRPDQCFFVSEQPTQPPPVTDAQSIRLSTWTDAAYGSRATIFFEFRSPLEGSEMGYISMLEPDGSFGGSAPALRQTFAEITRLQPQLAPARTIADIALIYSYENSWDQGFRIREGSRVGTGYDDVDERYYTGIKSLKRNVDVVPVTRDFTPYKVVVAPGLRIVSDEDAARLNQWVHAGGILVLDHKAGMRSPDGRLRPLVEPGVFAALSGIRVPGTLAERGTPHTVSFPEDDRRFAVADDEVVLLTGGEVLARYHGENLDGRPAITLHAAGRGFVVYVSFTCRQDAFFDALFASLARRFSIAPLVAAPNGVDVVSRTAGQSEYIFLLNNTQQPAVVDLPQSMTELLTNSRTGKRLNLAPLQLAILERTSIG
jgi:beta-galactosidase